MMTAAHDSGAPPAIDKGKRREGSISATEIRQIFPEAWPDILAKLRAMWGSNSFWWTTSEFGKAFGKPTWKARRWIVRQRDIHEQMLKAQAARAKK